MISKTRSLIRPPQEIAQAIEALTAAGQRTGTTTAVSNVTEVSPNSGDIAKPNFVKSL